MAKVNKITALEILDSRGNPTISTTVFLEDNSTGTAAVPSGASTGSHEAVELRDNDPQRYNGLGVLQAVQNVSEVINSALIGKEASDQKEIDQTMLAIDGTYNKSHLGANAILSVSLAVAAAQANSEKKPLYEYLTKFNPDFSDAYTMPIPQFNVENGGKHADFATDIQEFMILPIGASSTTNAIQMAAEVYQQLKSVLKSKHYNINVGDEGGFAPAVHSNREPFELLTEAIQKAGYEVGKDISFGIDAAASEFYHDGKYDLKKEGKEVSSDELIDFYNQLLQQYPIISMEDIFFEDDWEAFQKFTTQHKDDLQVVGDDLYVTNVKRLERGINEKTTNSILIKLNQIGTLTETVDAILLARKNNMSAIVSHRSGETEDTFIADFVVAMGTGQIKTGAPARSERVAKYNRLMKIESELKDKAKYATFPFTK